MKSDGAIGFNATMRYVTNGKGRAGGHLPVG